MRGVNNRNASPTCVYVFMPSRMNLPNLRNRVFIRKGLLAPSLPEIKCQVVCLVFGILSVGWCIVVIGSLRSRAMRADQELGSLLVRRLLLR